MQDDENSLEELLGEAVAAVEKTAPPAVVEPAPQADGDAPLKVPPRIDGSPSSPLAIEPDLPFEDALEGAIDEAIGSDETESPLVSLQTEIEQLKAKNEEISSRHLRLMADFDNFRKRNARERAAERRYASEPVLRDLLEVVDNMDRAIAAGAENPQLLKEGVGMIRSQLLSLLSRFGATPFGSIGENFDPELQEAVANIPDDRAVGEVIEELQKGYRFHERILRPARVVVSAGKLDNEDERLSNTNDNP